MRRIDDNTFEIITYDNGVLHFVIGWTYKAVGTSGESKDKEVTGNLYYSLVNKELMLYNQYHGNISINERTLSYL